MTRLKHAHFPPLLAGLALLLASCGPSGGPRPASESLSRAQYSDGNYICWKEHRIDDEDLAGGVRLRGAERLRMADLDKDGRPDIVSLHQESDHVRLAFGSGDPDDWFILSLAEGGEVPGATDVAAGDLNADGYPDVVAACQRAHLMYLENPGGKVRGLRWERVVPDATANRGAFLRVFLADLNQDGRLEAVTARQGAGSGEGGAAGEPGPAISWFAVPDDPLDGAGWQEHVIVQVESPLNAQPIDLDGDGDLDIFGASGGAAGTFWLENLGGEEVSFQQHAIEVDSSALAQGEVLAITGSEVEFIDLDGDQRIDLVLAGTLHTVVWLQQPQEPSQAWTLHSIGSIAPDNLAGVAVADINNDGKPDVMAGSASAGPGDEDGAEVTVADPVGRLAWFEQPGDLNRKWERHDLSRRKRGRFGAFVPRDLDGDGDLDFVGARGSSDKQDGVFWLEQVHYTQPMEVFEPARAVEGEELPLAPGR